MAGEVQELQKKLDHAKAWGKEQARAADQLGRDLKAAQDDAAAAREAAAELDAAKEALAAANARIREVEAENATLAKQVKAAAARAEAFVAIRDALAVK